MTRVNNLKDTEYNLKVKYPLIGLLLLTFNVFKNVIYMSLISVVLNSPR